MKNKKQKFLSIALIFLLALAISFPFRIMAVATGSDYWKTYFSDVEKKAVQKNAEKYTLSEIKKKSKDWHNVFTGFNIKNGSISSNDIKSIDTGKIKNLNDTLSGKLSTSGGTLSGLLTWAPEQTFNAGNLTGTYAALDGSQITGITASQTGAVPYSGATGNVDLNEKNLINLGNVGIGTTSPATLLDVVGDISLNKVNILQNHQVYVMGDSLSNNTYESALTNLLGSSWNVNSKGIGGNTTTQMLDRFSADVIVGDAEYVVILGGINDVLAGVSASTIQSNLQSMYTAAHNNGSKVIAITITPFKNHTSWTSGFQAVVDDVNSWITSASANVDYKIDAYSILENPSDTDTLLPTYDNGDHLHLSSAGYSLLATTINEGVIWTPDPIVKNITVSGDNVSLSQSLRATDSPQFSGLAINGLTSKINLATPIFGLGTISPQRTLDLRASDLVLGSNDRYAGNLLVMSNDADAGINKGGSIGLGGAYAQSSYWTFASIKGAKESSTGGEAGGYLSFWTARSDGNTFEHARMNSTGFWGINTTSPATYLDINPAITLGSSGITGATFRNHLVTLSGSNPTTYDTIYELKLGDMQLYSTNANQTVTNSASLVTGWPWKSTNVTATNIHSILVPTRAGTGAVNSYGITVNATTGSTNNYAAAFLGGNVGIGTTNPVATLDINGTAKLKKYIAEPFACDATHDGTTALTSTYRTCVCNGGSTTWVYTSDGTTSCVWQ